MNKENKEKLYKLLLEILKEQKDKENDIAFMWSKTIDIFKSTEKLINFIDKI